MLPRETSFTFQWRYDQTAKGRWPHCGVLIRAVIPNPKTDDYFVWRDQPDPVRVSITTEMVQAAWEPLWIDDYGGEFFDAQCEPIYDVAGAITYFTKVGRNKKELRQVRRQEWHGRMSGGNRSFFCAPKGTTPEKKKKNKKRKPDTKSLWRSKYHKTDYKIAEWAEVELRLAREYPWMVSDAVAAPHSQAPSSPDCIPSPVSMAAPCFPKTGRFSSSIRWRKRKHKIGLIPSSTHLPITRNEKQRQAQLPIGDCNLISNLFGISVHSNCIYVAGPATMTNHYQTKTGKRFQSPIGNCHSNRLLRYFVWANAP